MAQGHVATEDWARQNKAAFELTPLFEMHKGARVQVGFELNLHARMPAPISAADDREPAIEAPRPREGARGSPGRPRPALPDLVGAGVRPG